MNENKLILSQEIQLQLDEITLTGNLNIPENAQGIVLFAHGSGSGRKSPRNRQVASYLQKEGIATLLFDLLTEDEEGEDMITRELRFNIPLLADRLIKATEWVNAYRETHRFTVGYFGASTGAAAALIAASELGEKINAVVSRGGRPDLAGNALPKVVSPTLLIVGGNDYGVIELNEKAYNLLSGIKKLEIVPDATHLFEEAGTLEEVSRLATHWFNQFL